MAKKIKYKAPYIVQTWFERGRSNIWVEDAKGRKVAEWRDEAVSEMIEDGFFDIKGFLMGREIRPRILAESVLNYLVSMKIIPENYTYEIE